MHACMHARAPEIEEGKAKSVNEERELEKHK